MPEHDAGKRQAARAAVALVETGMVVGLGSGTTAEWVVRELARRVRDEDLRVVGVSTSEATAGLARALAIPVADLDDVEALDVDIDGADEVDPRFRMIKGRGGAFLREKLVAVAARRRIIVVTPEKRVDRLGLRFPVPVEVSPFGLQHIERRLQALGASTALRFNPDGSPFATDGGHRVLDCRFPGIDDPEGLDLSLRSTVGVFETGLFLGLCDLLIVGHPDGAERFELDRS